MRFPGDLPPHFGIFLPNREVSVQIGATQPAQDEHLAHLKHVLRVYSFCYTLPGITLSKISGGGKV
jgi:hypothetical protein